MLSYFEGYSESDLIDLQLCFERTTGMVSFDEAMLLYSLAKSIKSGCIVEVGSYRGRSTVFLAKGSLAGGNVKVYAIDPHKEFIGVLGGVFGPKDRAVFYQAMLENKCAETVALINLSSEMFSSLWSEEVSLVWIDGDHSYEGVKRDFECWQPHLGSNSIIVFDDATDTNLGPCKLIRELVASSKYEFVIGVGKVVVIQQCGNGL